MTTGLPGDYPLTVYRGDTKDYTLEFTETTGGAAVNLSGWTWLAEVRSTRDEPDPVTATFTVDSSDAATGVLVVTLPAVESAKLVTDAGRATYYWDLQGTDGGVVKTWLTGKVKVTGDVSVDA